MVSFVANHRSCFVSSAYLKQLCAKLSMESSRLCCPCNTPAPVKLWISSRTMVPSSAVNTSSALPGPGTFISDALYTSPYACLAIVIGFSQVLTFGSIPFTTIGARNTVPSSMARMVPFGLFHISFKLYSVILAAFGVIVAHLTATPYFFVAFAESTVT